MATIEILVKRAYSFLALALGDNGYEVASGRIGGIDFFLASKNDVTCAVTLCHKTTLKAARANAVEPDTADANVLRGFLALPVVQVNVFGSVKKASITLVAPAELNLAASVDERQHLTIESRPALPKRFSHRYTLAGFDPKNEIAIRWSVRDVKVARPDLLDEEAREVLAELTYLNEYEDGVNLAVVRQAANQMFAARYVPCTLYPEKDPANPVPALLNLNEGSVSLEADVLAQAQEEGYTHINGHTGEARQIVGPVAVQAGEITLPALGDERLEAYQGFVFDGDPIDLAELTERLAAAGPMPAIGRK